MSAEIRDRFLKFFEGKGHTLVASDMLVPRNDPTILFSGAGMNQFKDQFMGKNITFKRAASCQKCLRTGDLENAGKTPRHHTFFEMLGNFSFGDYFKKEAILWGWEFMTVDMGISSERLWVSVYEKDEESYEIWRDVVKVPKNRIVRLGPKDNFWPADAPAKGPNGPCGPCSEIFFDLGQAPGGVCDNPNCDPACDCGRFLEVWNLVFTEFERKSDGSLVPLPNKNIDTGMGMERIAQVTQGVSTNFETDLFKPLTACIKREIGDASGDIPLKDIYLVADHLRAVVFAIADGVWPSNEKQGYVIRKLIRRAYLKNARNKPFLYKVVPVVTDLMREAYPGLGEKREHISAIVKAEEEKFNDTLNSAMPVLDDMLSAGAREMKGEDIFKLVDTYGLPLDAIEEKTAPMGVKLDHAGFRVLMDGRKEQSRRGSNIDKTCIFKPDLFKDVPVPETSSDLPLMAEILFILKDGKPADEVSRGEIAEVVLSPQSGEFYVAQGGQVGDSGTITKKGALMNVVDTCQAGGRKVLEVSVEGGCFRKKDKVILSPDAGRKKRTAMNHTATHLLQAALRQVLGGEVKQSGSLVDGHHLRFDFTHTRKVTDRELGRIEDIVNGWISENISVCKETMSLSAAKEKGALSFFGEKYGETVKMVSVGNVSRELCGGIHVDNTSEISIFKIMSESSIASGIRRIEALTGSDAVNWLRTRMEKFLKEFEDFFVDPADRDDVGEKVEGIPEALKATRSFLGRRAADVDIGIVHDYGTIIMPVFAKTEEYVTKAMKRRQKTAADDIFNEVKTRINGLLDSAEMIGAVKYVSDVLPNVDMSVLRKVMIHAGKKIGSGVIVMGSSMDGKVSLFCSVTSDLAEKGLSARNIVNGVVDNIEGGGGGNETFAQAGGKNPDGLKHALSEAKRMVKEAGDII